MKRHVLSALVAASLLVGGPPLVASRVRRVGLAEMAATAERIFAGRCTEVATVHDTALGGTVLVTSFAVERTLKGDASPAITLRMPTDAVAGLPRFEVGQDVILFLRGESALGLSSPVGLEQGKFTVVEDKLGRRIALNGAGNRGLAAGLPPEARSRLGIHALDEPPQLPPLAEDALLDAIEWLVGREGTPEAGR